VADARSVSVTFGFTDQLARLGQVVADDAASAQHTYMKTNE